MGELAKMLIFIGMILAALGVLLLLAPKIPWLGKLPGDFVYRGERVTFYFPLATSIILSVILTLLFNLFRR
jgi:hypothetical protein